MDHLSNELVIEILSYLNNEALMNAMQCCVRWRNLIKETPVLMKNLKYSIIVSRSEKFKSPKIIDDLRGGKHQHLRVFNLNTLNLHTVRRCMFKYKDTIKHLSLFDSKLDFSFFCSLVQNLPQLTHICLVNVKISQNSVRRNDERDENIQLLELPRLQHLEIVDTSIDGEIKNIFKVPNLKSFRGAGRFGNRELVLFLLEQNKLQELSIKQDAVLLLRFMVDYPFKLRKLTMNHMYERKLRSIATALPVEYQRYLPNDRLIYFLMNQIEHLEELIVHNCPEYRMLRFIASDLKVKKLELGIEALDSYDMLFDGINKNHFLKELVLYGRCYDWVTVKQIIEQFPAIECLRFRNSELHEESWLVNMLSSLLKIKVVFEDIVNDEFNSIKNVTFYINVENYMETFVICQEMKESKLRMQKLLEAEARLYKRKS